jgi:uncharacterized protein (DUF305 family)
MTLSIYGRSPLRGFRPLALGIMFLTLSAPLTSCMQHTSQSSSTQDGTASNHSMMQHGAGDHAMDLGPADADYDLRFIDAMIPHHEGALLMAEQAQQNSQRPEIKQLANAILQAQDTEIQQMLAWRKSWYPEAPGTPMAWHATGNHMMPMTEAQRSSMQMDMSLGSADSDFDRRFIDAMIPHHEAAVTMAQDLQAKSQRPEMKQLATDIIAAQSEEIAQMKAWRESWY